MSLDRVVKFSGQVLCIYTKNWVLDGHILLKNFIEQHKHVWFGMIAHGLPRHYAS